MTYIKDFFHDIKEYERYMYHVESTQAYIDQELNKLEEKYLTQLEMNRRDK